MTVERHPFRRAKGPLTSTTQVDSEAATGEAVHLPEGSPGVSVSKVVGPAIEITVHMSRIRAGMGFQQLWLAVISFSLAYSRFRALGAGITFRYLCSPPFKSR